MAEDGNTLLAELCLPDAYRTDFNTFRWHPAMMDIAASLALRGAYGFVPAGCRMARLHSPLTAHAFALVRITDRQQGMIVADCTVTDASGQIVAGLEGMTFMALRKGQTVGMPGPDVSQPEPELYSIGWKKVDLKGSVPGPQNIILLGGQGGLLSEALEPLAHARRPLPADADEIRTLAREILAGPTDHLLWLPSLKSDAQNDTWPLCALLQEICSGGLRRPLRVTVVGSGAFVSGGSTHEPHQESLPQGALYMGPLLCLPWEEPRISCAYVELEDHNTASVAALTASLGLVDGPYVAACDGAVRVRELVKLPSANTTATPVITKDGCVVISGGLGGMGQTLARQIHERYGARVVLLHRSRQLPPHALEDVPFAAFRCDVADAAQVEGVFAKIRREVGPVQGVIHTAGVAGRGYLLTSDRQGYESVLAPKVAGTWNLHKATLGDNLAFFVLASSRTALVGAPGQSDYTAANAYLNAFARYRRSLGLPALSINWNTWSGVGMAVREGLGKGPEAATMLPPQQALAVLEAALASGEELVAVGMTGENAEDFALNGLPGSELAGRMLGSASISGGAAQGNAPQEQPRVNVEHIDGAALLEIIRDCLGYDRPLTREDDFFDLGGDSIAATRIVNRLDKEAGLALAVADLLESDTLGDIVDCALASRKPAQPLQKNEETTPVLDKYPVGNEQLAILYADMVSEGDLGFNLPAFLVMPPNADAARLEKALAHLVERHEALRTSFCDFEAERPAMIIHPYTGFTLEERRIPDLAHKDDIIRPFNLRNETGFRACLLVTDAGEKVLFIDLHHALGDGRTMSLLNVELYRLYHGLELGPVTAQMKDIAWQQVTHPDAEAAAYWQNIYKGELPRLDMPASYPRPRVHTGRGGTYEFDLAPELVQAIKGLARREGLTNYQVSLCAWSLLAQAYTGSQDIVVAVSMDARGEHLNTAGMLASVLPLRFCVDPDQPLSAQLRATRQVSNEGMRHRAYILNSLLADLRQTAWPDRSPLSEIILSYMNFEFAAEGQGLFESLRFSKFSSKTDLSIFVSDIGESISIALEYYADLFSEADVLRMARDYVRMLELMTSAPADAPLRFTPTDLPCAAGGTASLEKCEALVPAALRQAIEAVAAGKGASAEAVLLAVFAVLMGKVTQQEQFVVEVPPERAVSFSIDDNMEFDELLAFTQKGLTENVRMGDAGQGDSGYTGMPAMQGRLRLGFDFAGADAQGKGYGLFCSVREQEDGLALHFAYDPQQVGAEAAQDWLTYYGNFLEGIVEGAA
ncbi:MAG: SDR family oxidoreductase [Desulfovibrio sp.]